MTAPTATIRAGDWRTALADVDTVDAVICDPPYGAGTHSGSAGDAGIAGRRELGYSAWTADDVGEFVESWAPRCRGWFVALTSDDLIPAWIDAYESAGRYAFAPVPCMARKVPRLLGDGPGSWFVYAMVARPRTREFASWGTLPGGYINGPTERCARVGGKPEWLMRALVRDYTRPGDLICDPFAGAGTTLVAAVKEGRSAVGAELEPEWAEHTQARIDDAQRRPGLFAIDFSDRAGDAVRKRQRRQPLADLFAAAPEDTCET